MGEADPPLMVVAMAWLREHGIAVCVDRSIGFGFCTALAFTVDDVRSCVDVYAKRRRAYVRGYLDEEGVCSFSASACKPRGLTTALGQLLKKIRSSNAEQPRKNNKRQHTTATAPVVTQPPAQTAAPLTIREASAELERLLKANASPAELREAGIALDALLFS